MTTFAVALAHAQRGEFAAAESVLLPLIKRERKNADALHLLANVLHAKGDLAGALSHFAAAVKLAPGDAALAFNHAVVLAAAERHAEAADAFARALALKPNDAEALLARGASLAALQDYAGALECYESARAEGLDRPDLHANRGAALAALSQYDEAVAACDVALANAPNDVKSLFNRGAALLALDRYDESLAALDAALAGDPEHTIAHAVRSGTLASLGRFDEALIDVDFALARQPDRVDHLMRLGYVFATADRRPEALAVYERVLAQTPNDAEALYGAADALLAAGDFARGLDLYEARLQNGKPLCAPSPAPRWRGEDLVGKTLLVQGEQGFGDLFQFSRFIPELAAHGARVILQERAQTRALMQSLAGLAAFVPSTAPPPPADFHIHLCSVMHAQGMRLETIPAPIPYLSADAARVARWREKLEPTQRKRIGVAWLGNKRYALQRARGLSPEALEALFSADAEFVSLQLDAGDQAPLLAAHGVRDFGADTRNFAELAALIENLDLVISIDTGVAHLAGALGKPLWIMLPFCADWRWLRERDDTPWYPHARLFRQPVYGDWKSVTDAVLAALMSEWL